MRRAKQRAVLHPEAPQFDVPLSIKAQNGSYEDHYGRLDIAGFYFETTKIPMIGQSIMVRVVLVGLGVEIETAGTVTHVESARGHVAVTARFDEIEFETERMIARWLDLMNMASHRVAS